MARTGTPEVAVITSAPQSVESERQHRQKIYLIRMGIRTVMFLLAVALPVPVWVKLVIIFASIPVPLFAVTAASHGNVRKQGADASQFAVPTRASVEAMPTALPAGVTVIDADDLVPPVVRPLPPVTVPAPPRSTVVLDGEVV